MALGVDLVQISVLWLFMIRNAPGGDKYVDDDDNGHHDGDGPVELDALLEVVLGAGVYIFHYD